MTGRIRRGDIWQEDLVRLEYEDSRVAREETR